MQRDTAIQSNGLEELIYGIFQLYWGAVSSKNDLLKTGPPGVGRVGAIKKKKDKRSCSAMSKQ
jgi:hypothetical protein